MIQVHEGGDQATLTSTLPADELPAIASAAERMTEATNRTGTGLAGSRGVFDGAPGEIRTHTGRVLNPLPLPVGLRGRSAGNSTGPALPVSDRVR